MNKQQELFCKEFLTDLNATQAAIRAGYSEDSARQQGSRLLTNDDIQANISKLMSERSERLRVSSDFILNDLIELKEICMGRKPVMITNKDGSITSTTIFEHSGANRSIELIGKHLSMFTNKSEITTKGFIPESIKIEYV